MAQFKRVLAIVLAVCMLVAVGVVVAGAVDVSEDDKAATPVGAGGITVHYYCESGTPTVYGDELSRQDHDGGSKQFLQVHLPERDKNQHAFCCERHPVEGAHPQHGRVVVQKQQMV